MQPLSSSGTASNASPPRIGYLIVMVARPLIIIVGKNAPLQA
jgi:hypothetical protein